MGDLGPKQLEGWYCCKCNEGDFRRSSSGVGKGQGSALTELSLRYLLDLHRKVLRRQLSFREKDRLAMTDLESSE